MSADETMSLQRQLRPRQAAALLESFAALIPNFGSALIRSDGGLLATAGAWPHESLSETLSEVGSGGQAVEVLSLPRAGANACRYYPLFAGARQVGTLAARGDASDRNAVAGRVLHDACCSAVAGD